MEKMNVKIETYVDLPKCDKCGSVMALQGCEIIARPDGKSFWTRKPKTKLTNMDRYVCTNEACGNIYLSDSPEYGNVQYRIAENKDE